MTNLQDLVLTYIREDNAEKIRLRLFEQNLKTQKTTNVLSVFKEGSWWYAWFYARLNQVPPITKPINPDVSIESKQEELKKKLNNKPIKNKKR